ncbi:MAG: hypothetical protein H9W81_10175 [Enterococcus sp.]|nr:hypothetical protein [Enterococcus sp.]
MTDNNEDFPFGISVEDYEDEEAQQVSERETRRRAATVLEGLFSDRGLKFTAPFEGNIPVVAYGKVDGMNFYFRYRGDRGSLRVGTPDPQENLKHYRDKLESVLHETNRALEKGIAAEEIPFFPSSVSLKPIDMNRLFPEIVEKVASIEDYRGVRYSSYLDYNELIDLFSKLLVKLETNN